MTQLFTRDGAEFTGTPQFNDAGRAVRYVPVACDRCHVINGQRLWVMGTENGQPYSRTGFDCWTCGNTGVRREREDRLYTAEELARVNKAAATRAARIAQEQRVAREQAEAQQEARKAAFWAENSAFVQKLDALRDEENPTEFFNKLRIDIVGSLRTPSEKLVALVDAEIAKRAALAASRWIGTEGDKVDLTLRVEKIITLRSQWGTSWINVCRTTDGNVVVYKGTTDVGQEGETVTVQATIGGHELYGETRQTLIKRPKVLDEVVA